MIEKPLHHNNSELNVYRLVRIANELSVAELADRMQMSRGYVSEVETGKKKPSREFTERFCVATNTKQSTIAFFQESQDTHHLSYQRLLLLILKKMCGESDVLMNC